LVVFISNYLLHSISFYVHEIKVRLPCLPLYNELTTIAVGCWIIIDVDGY